MKIDFQTQVVLNEFGTRVFRNEADKDYIVARIAYRFAFDQQFLWSAETGSREIFESNTAL